MMRQALPASVRKQQCWLHSLHAHCCSAPPQNTVSPVRLMHSCTPAASLRITCGIASSAIDVNSDANIAAGKVKHLVLRACDLAPNARTDTFHALTASVRAVSRYKCKSDLYGADLVLDVNADVYPLELGGRYTMKLTQTLVADVSAQKEEYDPVRAILLLLLNVHVVHGWRWRRSTKPCTPAGFHLCQPLIL